jgi:hypothetical protein
VTVELEPADFEALVEVLHGFRNDPLEFVLRVFPWGEGELRNATGPSEWQTESFSVTFEMDFPQSMPYATQSQVVTELVSRLWSRGLSCGPSRLKLILEA